MSRSQLLNGVARNVAHKFSASANHFAYMAYSHRIQSIRIDLLSGKINSDLFHIDRNNILVKMCIENLHRMLSGIRMTPDIIKEAYLDIYFDIPSNTITEKTVDQIRCKFEVKFIHSDGRQFIGVIKDDVIIQP